MYTLLVSIAVVLASLSEGARAYVGSKEMLREAGVSEALISKNIGSIKVQNDNVKVIPTEGEAVDIRNATLASRLSEVLGYRQAGGSCKHIGGGSSLERRTDGCTGQECFSGAAAGKNCFTASSCTCLKQCGPHGIGCTYSCYPLGS